MEKAEKNHIIYDEIEKVYYHVLKLSGDNSKSIKIGTENPVIKKAQPSMFVFRIIWPGLLNVAPFCELASLKKMKIIFSFKILSVNLKKLENN